MVKGTTNDEIMDYFDMDPDLIPSQSAFNQRRNQISLSAFEYLFSDLIDYKGYNHMHLNGFVDVISKAFLDIVIQPGQKPDERQAFHMMQIGFCTSTVKTRVPKTGNLCKSDTL
jgi:hypothetical protein